MRLSTHRAALPLALLALLVLPSQGWGQQELRSGKKGVTSPAPVTSTPVDADTQALDVYIRGGASSGGDGALLDGVSAAIKATVKDYPNSNPLTTILVDSNGDPASVGGGTQYNQGSATTDTDQLMMAGCVRVDTPAVASGVIDGDRARCIVDSTNRLWVHVGVIDGTVAVTQSGIWNIGTLTSITNPVAVTGTFWQATQPVSGTVTANAGTGTFFDGVIRDGTGDTTQANVSAGNVHIDVRTALPTGANTIGGVNLTQYTPVSGRLPVDGSGVTQPVSMATNQPVGTVAHDVADSGNPVKIGCHARITTRIAVADADRADVVCDKNGRLVTTPMAPRDRVVRSGVITLTTTTETTLVAAGGAGVFRDLTYLKCTNNSGTLTRVDLRDATAGTVIDSWALAASGGGFNLAWSVPYAQATANNNWTVQLSGAVTDVRCSAQAVETN